jgi:formylglycine-generating enzyme required for sulfatase activity/PKD repeat protein
LLHGGRDSAGFRSDLWQNVGGCNRAMSTISSAVAGQTAQYRYNYPGTAIGNLYLELWTLRNPISFYLPISGFTVVGLTRIDVFNILLQNGGVLGASGQQPTGPFAVPNSPAVVGATFDVQNLDLDLASNGIYWASNDVEATVAVGPPTASFTATPTGGSVPLTVQFTDTSTFATSWQWDFQNDGVIDSTAQNPSFTYTAAGTYSVRLVATGPGGSNTLTQAGLITTGPPSFTATPAAAATAPLTVQFAGSAPFAVTQWAWDFQNDGVNDAFGPNPTFTYTANGIYSVRLTVTTPVAPFTITLVRPGAVVVDPIVGTPVNAALNLALIVPGTYLRGSPVTPLGVGPYFNQAVAQPVHSVTISRPFWIGRFEVTQAQYQAVMGSNPSFFQGPSYPNAAQRPVEQVTWNNAVAYCTALTASEQAAGRVPAGYVYRLPTEAEWEYCCRAGTTTEFHFGPTLVCGQANFGFSYHSNTNCSINQTAVVGSYPPNAWGLHDMHGNVWEWCQDAWDFSANYPSGPVTDPVVACCPFRVVRGGSWFFDSNFCRSAFRYSSDPAGTLFDFGFRVVLASVLP